MKQQFLILCNKIDALSLRERLMVFAGAAALIVFVLNSMMLVPLFAKQKALSFQLRQFQASIERIDAEIAQTLQASTVDPDAANRTRLASIRVQHERLSSSLRARQDELVAPEKMAPLLEAMLRTSGRLRLVSMKTLPVSPVNESGKAGAEGQAPATAAPSATAPATAPAALLYRHGVQLTVRGNYLDMIGYMDALEAMPTRLFWGEAALQVEQYPNSRLTLTLYTLSLDQKWMKL